MAERAFPDEWLVATVAMLVGAEKVAALRAQAQPTSTLWELVTAGGHATDDKLL